jgi:hypothetical protein
VRNSLQIGPQDQVRSSARKWRLEGGDPLISTAAEYADDIDKQEKKWGAPVRKLNLKVEERQTKQSGPPR